MLTVRVKISKNKQKKRLFLQIKSGRIIDLFVGVFNKTIIPHALVGYAMIIANSYQTGTRGVIVKYSSVCQILLTL